jgi:hypothetical protein
MFQSLLFEVWLSLVERCVRDAEAASSSLVTSTILKDLLISLEADLQVFYLSPKLFVKPFPVSVPSKAPLPATGSQKPCIFHRIKLAALRRIHYNGEEFCRKKGKLQT